jgi:uncharacterized protein with HEPN domain
MASSKNPTARLRHILDEAHAIQEATRNLTFETFQDSWLIRRAIEHGLMIVAEASKALPQDLKALHPDIPWRRIASFGNVLRHEYKDVDPVILWRIVHEQLPDLVTAVREMLAKFDG